MDKKKIIGYYDYTVILTYLGMVVAFGGILEAINGRFLNSIVALMLAGICDMFDGAIASTKSRDEYQKAFGIQIDSLCDLVSFGVLPAVFAYLYSDKNPHTALFACVYLLCGLIRLAYFNVQEFERQKNSDGKRESYLGVPITSVAIVLPLLFIFYDKFAIKYDLGIEILLLIHSTGHDSVSS